MKDPEDIRAWQRLSSTITTSGRLKAGDPARLAAIGTRLVINLALSDHPEALEDEADAFAVQGVEYTHIPVPFDAPSREHFEAFKFALESSVGPVHVHCIMNWRVSAFFYLLHIEQGMAESEARELMTRQWDPLAAEEPYARPWAALIGQITGRTPTSQ
ncbi:MAG: protein tyrosine phosphatase family protein [Erythrobacter sp.]